MISAFCKDCKWAKKSWWESFKVARCFNPKAYETRVDLVSGEVKIDASYCSTERLNMGHCHPKAILFESKTNLNK